MGMIYRRKKKLKDGTVVELPNWHLKYYRDGKPYYESSKTSDRRKAERLLVRREAEIEQGKTPGIVAERISYDDLMAGLEQEYTINGMEKALADLRHRRVHLDPFFRGLKATRITSLKVKAYVESRQKSGRACSNGSINRELSYLSRMFSVALENGLPVTRPVTRRLPQADPRSGCFEYHEIERLLHVLPDYLKPVVVFANATGWRRGEILNLRWERVNLQEGTIRLERKETKGKSARLLVLEPSLKTLIDSLWEKRSPDCSYVFQHDGRKIGGKTDDFSQAWAKACRDAGLEGKLFHDLRRTGVRNMVRAGISERVAMQVSGHKTRSIFDRYNITSEEDLRVAAEKRAAFEAKQIAALHAPLDKPETVAAKPSVN